MLAVSLFLSPVEIIDIFILYYSCYSYLKITLILITNLKFPVNITPTFRYYLMCLLLITNLFLKILENSKMICLLHSIISFMYLKYIMLKRVSKGFPRLSNGSMTQKVKNPWYHLIVVATLHSRWYCQPQCTERKVWVTC